MTRLDLDALSARVDALPTHTGALAAWFMDIDGVLNLLGRPPREGWGVYKFAVVPAFEGLAWKICYAPVLIDLLNRLHAKGIISFRWLTTWEHDAPTSFAPAVGLDIGSWVAAEDTGLEVGWWKLAGLLDHLGPDGDELFIWTDDDIFAARADNHADGHLMDMLPERVMVVCTNSSKGLTPEDFDAILSRIETEARRRVAVISG